MNARTNLLAAAVSLAAALLAPARAAAQDPGSPVPIVSEASAAFEVA